MKIRGMRWVILSLIVLVTIINILDRGTLNYMWQDEVDKTTGVLIQPGIVSELKIVNNEMPPAERQQRAKEVFALINICFMVAYGISQLLSGAMYDRVGTRNGFSISALIWGGAISLTSIVTGIKQLAFFRILLGLGEAGIGGASAILGIIISTYLVPILTKGGNWLPFFAMGLLLIPASIISVYLFSPRKIESSDAFTLRTIIDSRHTAYFAQGDEIFFPAPIESVNFSSSIASKILLCFPPS